MIQIQVMSSETWLDPSLDLGTFVAQQCTKDLGLVSILKAFIWVALRVLIFRIFFFFHFDLLCYKEFYYNKQ